MTNEQAKKMLKAKLECLKRETSGTDFDCNNSNCDECSLCYEQGNMREQKEALDMAIKALEQEPCEDTISRQAAIDALTALEEPAPTARHLSAIYDCEDAIKALPSAQPERKKGQWIDLEIDKDFAKCSECGSCWEWGFVKNCNMSFCPNCGADMRGESE